MIRSLRRAASMDLARLLVVSALACAPLFAQEVTGNILGTVTDQSGAAVPNAKVTVTNTDRNVVVREVTTNQTGNYSAPLLPLGHYDVGVEAQGFKRVVQRGFEVNASEKLTVNVTLEVGDLAQEISVEAASIQVETASAQQQGLISGTMVRELALNNRHFAQLLALQPGVVSATSDSMFVGTTNPSGGNNLVAFSVNGQRQSANNFTVDGADITDRGSNLTIINYPSVDAIEEVRIVRSAYSAEYGRSAGGQVNIVTKSGTNQFHGGGYEFFRNDKLNANSYLNNLSNVKRPPLRYNDFGYTFGGPVFIPGVYNKERNKTFFFWSQEFRRVINYTSPTATVPTADELQGRFTRPVCTGPVTDPCSSTSAQITNINPVAQAYIKDIWSKVPTSPNNILVTPLRGIFNSRQDMFRIDHNFGEKLNLAVRFLNDTIPTEEPRGLFTDGPLPFVHTTKTDSPGRTWVVRGTSTLTPNIYNEAGFTYSKGGIISEPVGLAATANSPDISVKLPFTSTLARVPSLVYSGGASSITSYGPYDNISNNYSLFDNVSWIRGNHTLKLGFLWNLYRKKENAAGANAGSFTFAGTPAPAGTTTFQQSWANFLLGNVSSFTQASVDLTPDLRMQGYEAYVHDDWKLTRNFTLNLGLRYSNFRQPYEVNNLLNNFYTGAYDPAQAVRIDPATGNIIAGSGNPFNGVISNTGKVPTGAKPSPWGSQVGQNNNANFAPRVGFAWDPFGTGTTSVRAGYGIFYDTQLIGIYQQNIFTNPPVLNSSFSSTRFEDPTAGTASISAAPLALRGTPTDYQTPYSQQWSFDIQKQIGKDFVATVAYVGSKGTHLLGLVDINQVPVGAAAAAGLIPAATPTNPGYITSGTPTNRLNALRPYKGYTAVNTIQTWFNSNYHSLQVSAQKRFTGGSLINLAYTWSKALTDNGSDRSNAPQNTYNVAGDYGLSPLDRRHVLTIAYVYEIPVFRTQQGFAGRVLGGWEVSGITSYFTGQPLTVISGRGYDFGAQGILGASGSSPRPDVAGDPYSGFTPSFTQFFNTAAFVDAPAGGLRPGNAGRGIIEGPSTTKFDISLIKNIRIFEQLRMQFRAEAFNAFNHTNYNTIGTSYGTATFGRVTGVRDPRNIQLALKLNF